MLGLERIGRYVLIRYSPNELPTLAKFSARVLKNVFRISLLTFSLPYSNTRFIVLTNHSWLGECLSAREVILFTKFFLKSGSAFVLRNTTRRSTIGWTF